MYANLLSDVTFTTSEESSRKLCCSRRALYPTQLRELKTSAVFANSCQRAVWHGASISRSYDEESRTARSFNKISVILHERAMDSCFPGNHRTYIDHSMNNNHRRIIRGIFSGILIRNSRALRDFSYRDIVKFRRVSKLAGDSSMPPRFLRHDRLRTVSRIHVMRQLSNEFSMLRVSRRSRDERGTTSRLCAHSTLRLRARYATRG